MAPALHGSPLGKVLATPSAVHLDGVAAALLDVTDPGHRQDVITTDARPSMAWNRWTARTADDPRWTVPSSTPPTDRWPGRPRTSADG